MAVKFRKGKSYHVFHNRGIWDGIIKVLDVATDGRPRVILTKLLNGGRGVDSYFKSFGVEGCFLGHADWNQKEVNMTLENK